MSVLKYCLKRVEVYSLGFYEALQLILVSVCTGFGLEIAKELVRGLVAWIHGVRKKVVK